MYDAGQTEQLRNPNPPQSNFQIQLEDMIRQMKEAMKNPGPPLNPGDLKRKMKEEAIRGFPKGPLKLPNLPDIGPEWDDPTKPKSFPIPPNFPGNR